MNDFEPMRKFLVALTGVVMLSFNSFAQRPDLPGHLLVDVGLNTWANLPTGAELNTWQSKTVNLTYFYDFPIGDGGFTFTPGIGLGLEKYTFDNRTTLTTSLNGTVRTVAITPVATLYPNTPTLNKSKLGLNYLDIPLEFRFYASGNDYRRGFRAAIGAKVGILYSSFTKVKLEDSQGDNRVVRDRQDLGFNRFRYGIQARAGFGGFSFFGFYELSKKFDVSTSGWARYPNPHLRNIPDRFLS